jgi:hypothetical protein
MVCYLIPMFAALVHTGMRKKVKSMNENVHQWWLSLLLAGGAIFGVIDHLWNGELFLIGPNIMADLALGVVITVGLCCVWAGIVALDKFATKKATTAQ